jgi:hypothetical protein
MQSKLFINHIGFMPNGPKRFLVQFPKVAQFSIVNRWNNQEVLSGALKPFFGKDLGEYCIGDFSSITEEGTYIITCGDLVSDVVVIHKKPYEMALRTLYNYYPTQRCGDSIPGWNSPCHLHDATSTVTGEHVDVGGGWHRSCDLRKWLRGTMHAIFGLTQLADYKAMERWSSTVIPEELQWGNIYFHKMITEEGRLRDYVSIPNDWDDDKPRILADEDAPPINFSIMAGAQCEAAIYFKDIDPEYSQYCLDKAKALWRYMKSPQMKERYEGRKFKYHEYIPGSYAKCFRGSAVYVGGEAFAASYLYRATGDKAYLESALELADALCALQVDGDVEKQLSAGCFWEDEKHREFDTISFDNLWGPMALLYLIKLEEPVANRGRYLEVMTKVTKQYVLSAGQNPWNLIPPFWYVNNPGGTRPTGEHFYSYFTLYPETDFGNNVDILGRAIILLEAKDLVDFGDACVQVALHQVEWVLGCNPFNVSTCEGVGYNQYQMLINSDEFLPPTPQIPGAVQTGFVSALGTDNPMLGVEKVSVEYDMPATSALMWVIKRLLEIIED